MVEHLGLRWALTLLFACVGALHVHRLGARPRPAGRVDDAAHGLMCAAMIVMAWPRTVPLPLWPQVVPLALGAAWFAGRGLAELVGGRSAAAPLSHVVGMGTMVWMLVAVRTHAHHGGAGWVALGLGLLSVAGAYFWFGEAVRTVRASRPCRFAVGHAAAGAGTAVMVFSML